MFEELVAELEGVVARLAECHVPADGPSMLRLRAAADQLQALTCEAQIRFDASGVWRNEGAGSLRGWLADAAGLGRKGAADAARRSERLEWWPAVTEAWVAGRLRGAQVEGIVATIPKRFVSLFANHAPEVVDLLEGLDAIETEAVLRQWVKCAEASDGQSDLTEQPSGVFVSVYADGRLAISGDLSPTEGAIVDAALRVFDVPDPVDENGEVLGERRSMAQRNADALVAMAKCALEHREGAGDGGRFLPHVSLVVDATEARAAVLRGAGVRSVAELDRCAAAKGWAPIEVAMFAQALAHHGEGVSSEGQLLDATALRTLTCDSVVQRVMMQGTKVIELGREVRTARHWQRKAVVARDRHCRAPGCRTKPRFCDVHHVDHWIDGGTTDVSRMVLLCGTHHREFHKDGYRMELDDDATFTVHSPHGWSRSSVPERDEQLRVELSFDADHAAFSRRTQAQLVR